MTPYDGLHIVVFDLETRRSKDEVGGWQQLRQGKGGISALIAHDSFTNEYALYDDHTLEDFAQLVEQSSVVAVGFNSKDFDIPCIQGCLGRTLRLRHHVDLFDLVKDALDREGRHRERGWKLDDCSRRSMGISKSGDGAFAPDLAKAGRFAELFTYCRNDVDMTRQLLDYVRRHGGVMDHGGHLLELDVPGWLRLPPAPEN